MHGHLNTANFPQRGVIRNALSCGYSFHLLELKLKLQFGKQYAYVKNVVLKSHVHDM